MQHYLSKTLKSVCNIIYRGGIMLENFRAYMVEEGKSKNTIDNYIRYVNKYFSWFIDSYGHEPKKLYRSNIIEFKSYLVTSSKLIEKSINFVLSAMIKYNNFLIDTKVQGDIVISKRDLLKVQNEIASPTDINKNDVERFRQEVLEHEGLRNYAIVTVLAYGGLRISEALNLKFGDLGIKEMENGNLEITKTEMKICNSKGQKTRNVIMNFRIIESINEYLKERKDVEGNDYVFVSNKGNKLDRTVLNKMFNKYSKDITPHSLRHFFCTNCLENGFGVHEVASLAGHSNINTTLMYTNPSRQAMLDKINRL